MILLDEETGDKYKVVYDYTLSGTRPTGLFGKLPTLVVEQIPKVKTFSWDDVADGVLVKLPYRDIPGHATALLCRDLIKIDTVPSKLRFSHRWNVWRGGDCPLPAGLMVEAEYRNGKSTTLPIYRYEKSWDNCGNPNDIIAYKVTGLIPPYVYPNEVES